METTQTVNVKAEALKNGAIWGAINIVVFLVSWYAMPTLMSSYVYAGLLALIGIALAVFFCIDLRKKAGGYWTFGDALWNIFVMFLLSMAIVYIFNIVFGKFIDPSYPATMKDLVMTKTQSTYDSIGMDPETAKAALEKVSESLDKQFSPTFSQAVVGFGISAVVYFIGALIFALIFKRSNPNPFAPANEEWVEGQ